jgi:XTP/dITP diphosphohydrolase
MTTLLVATTNGGKLREIRGLLAGLPLSIASLPDLPAVDEPAEPGVTFAENARAKAVHYARSTGLLTVAEDSGLEIDALEGAPGVHSARFPGVTYDDKFAELFRRLDERGSHDSAARFVCALAVARGEDILFEAQGIVEGRITRQPRGTHGFGYDPIFFYPPLGRTLAELDETQKSEVSHRGRAIRALRAFLERRELPY